MTFSILYSHRMCSSPGTIHAKHKLDLKQQVHAMQHIIARWSLSKTLRPTGVLISGVSSCIMQGGKQHHWQAEKPQGQEMFFWRLGSGKPWLDVYFLGGGGGGEKKKTFLNLKGILLLNFIPITWLMRSKKGKIMRNPTLASFIELSVDIDFVSWTMPVPQTLPDMHLEPMAVSIKVVKDVLRHWEVIHFPLLRNSKSVPPNAGPHTGKTIFTGSKSNLDI